MRSEFSVKLAQQKATFGFLKFFSSANFISYVKTECENAHSNSIILVNQFCQNFLSFLTCCRFDSHLKGKCHVSMETKSPVRNCMVIQILTPDDFSLESLGCNHRDTFSALGYPSNSILRVHRGRQHLH